jgi:hypothetical protein
LNSRAGPTAVSGQASVEAVAGTVVLLLTALVCFQLLATGYAASLADGAATAGAVALVRGEPVESAVRDALPGWARSRISVGTGAGSVQVRLRPPSLFGPVSERLEITSTASAKPG